MNQLTLVKSFQFGKMICDVWTDDFKDFFITRNQIGEALDYARPTDAIQKIHERHCNRLDKFSSTVKLTGVDGKLREHTVYNAKGVYEICRWSEQPNADEFYDAVYEILELLRKGEAKLTSAKPQDELQTKRIEIMERNSRQREAKIYMQIANDPETEKIYKGVLKARAVEVLSGERLLPYPELIKREYTATEVGEMYEISANAVGKLANKLKLKAPEGESNKYGRWIHTKSRHSAREVKAWVYFEESIEAIGQALEESKIVSYN